MPLHAVPHAVNAGGAATSSTASPSPAAAPDSPAPSTTASSSSLSSAATQSPLKRRRTAPTIPHLPDELLSRVLLFVNCAPTLARLRLVSPAWRSVIDNSPALWSRASFKRTFFARHVVPSPSTPPTPTPSPTPSPSPSFPSPYPSSASPTQLCLGARPGARFLSLAASAGNEWAAFLQSVFFSPRAAPPLVAVTLPPHAAAALVRGAITSFRPPVSADAAADPAHVLMHAAAAAAASCGAADREGRAGDVVARGERWVVVHAAREKGVCGGIVGLVRVARWRAGAMVGEEVLGSGAGGEERWTVLRAVCLERRILCGGFIGLWPVSPFLAELLVRALHKQ